MLARTLTFNSQNSLPLSQVRFISSSFWAHIWYYVDYCVISTGTSNCAKYSNDAWKNHKVFVFFPQITLWCCLLCIKNTQCEQQQNNINLIDEYVELITFCFVAQKWGQNLKLYMYDAIQISLLFCYTHEHALKWFGFLFFIVFVIALKPNTINCMESCSLYAISNN